MEFQNLRVGDLGLHLWALVFGLGFLLLRYLLSSGRPGIGTVFRDCMLLGGSWVVISGVVSPLIWVIIVVTLLITL